MSSVKIGELIENRTTEVAVIELLEEKGAHIAYNDRYVPSLEVNGKSYSSIKLNARTIEDTDCVVILTAQSGIDTDLLKASGVPRVDTRNAL